MPARVVPVVDLTTLQFLKGYPANVLTGTMSLVGSKWRAAFTDIIYSFDPRDAHSIGKPNIIYPDRTYHTDGDLDTTGTFVTVPGTGVRDADAGVDMGSVGDYLVFFKIGLYSASSAYSAYAYLYGSADLTTWLQLWSTSTASTTEVIVGAGVRGSNYRAFKVMMAGAGANAAFCRTYELSVYKLPW